MHQLLWYTPFQQNTPSESLPFIRSVVCTHIEPPFRHTPCRERSDDIFLLKLTISGHGFFKYGDQITRMEPGMFFFCRTSDPQAEFYLGDSHWQHIFISIEGKAFNDLGDALIKEHGHIHRDINGSLRQLLLSYKSKNNRSQNLTPQENWQIVNLLCSALMRSNDFVEEKESLAQKAHNFMRHSSLLGLNVNSIAAELRVSREHLSRQFQRTFGHSPVQEITQLRLEHARTLLISTELSIAEIAYHCGITSESFSAWFRRQQGSSPGQYRQEKGSIKN